MKTRSDQLLSARELLADDNKTYASTTIQIPENANVFKLEGKKPRRIDIIPYIVGENNPEKKKGSLNINRSYYVHYNIGPSNKAVLCPQTYGKPCPICEEYDSLSWPDKKSDAGKALKSKKRHLWNVIDVDNHTNGIQIWDIADWNFAESLRLADEALDEGDKRRYWADPTGGSTLKLTVAEKPHGGGGNYLRVERIDFNPRTKQYKESISRKAWCLDDVLKPALPYKKLKNLFHQSSSDDGEEDSHDSGGSHHERNGSGMKLKSVTAKSKGIKVGSTVEHPDLAGDCIVTAISKNGKEVTIEDEDSDESVVSAEVLELVEKKGKGKAAAKKKTPVKKKGKKVVEEDEESELEEEEESSEPEEEEKDSDLEEEESEEEDSEMEEEESEEEEEDSEMEEEESEEEDSEMEEEESEEEEEKPKKKVKAKPKAKAKAKK